MHNRLPQGLYKIYWKEGGSSLASVGSLNDGTRWYAPCNWTGENEFVACTDWDEVERVELINSSGTLDKVSLYISRQDAWLEFKETLDVKYSASNGQVVFIDGHQYIHMDVENRVVKEHLKTIMFDDVIIGDQAAFQFFHTYTWDLLGRMRP